jgi:hypothetical protein
MNELKFSCPKCGQHLTAEPAWSGVQIKCPVCKADVTVPSAGAGALAPFSHFQSASGLPPIIEAPPPPLTRPATVTRKSSAPWLIIALVIGFCFVLLALAGIALLLFFRSAQRQTFAFRPPPPPASDVVTPSFSPPADQRSQRPSSPYRNAVPNQPEKPVTTDPLTVEIPAARVSGSLVGISFSPNVIKIEHGILKLGQGAGFLPDFEVLIFLFLNDQSPAGKSWTIPDPDHGSGGYRATPHVHFRSKQGATTQSHALSSNYAMRLEFGTPKAGKIPGRIYLELPEPYASKLAGSFEAQLTPERSSQ